MLVSLKTLASKAVCIRVDGGERESGEGAQGYFVCEYQSLIVFLQKHVFPIRCEVLIQHLLLFSLIVLFVIFIKPDF
jgi:hypothetical protein